MYTIHTLATRKDGSIFENSCRFLSSNRESLAPAVAAAEEWETKTIVEASQVGGVIVAETPNGRFQIGIAELPPFDGGLNSDISYTRDFDKA